MTKLPCMISGESDTLGNIPPCTGEIEILSSMAGTAKLRISGFLSSIGAPTFITIEIQKGDIPQLVIALNEILSLPKSGAAAAALAVSKSLNKETNNG